MKKNILVITHDAGGSEIIGAYLKEHRSKLRVHSYIAGPALSVFKQLGLPFNIVPFAKADLAALMQKYADVDLVLLGTGWMTTIEKDALAIAKEHGLKTAVYLESWAKFRHRFGYPKRDWKENLSDEIWVGDTYAHNIAKTEFPFHTVKLVRNQYFANIVSRYKKIRHKNATDILFLSNIDERTKRAFKALLVYYTHAKRPPVVRVRFHPADDRTRFDALIEGYPGKVKKSDEKDIVKDLARARVVVGTETTAMATAVLVGKKTISIVPTSKKSMLPFKEIIKVSALQNAFSYL